ncbi:MAG: aldose 1-epimerase family protein [Solirubrobacterales bacterium]|nr:aldose 1-epimerase family protein [Solirubrobacterales bacterium]
MAGIRLVTLGDGAERGVRVLEFRTGSGFAFDVLVDRGFDIGRCALGGKPLAWESGVGVAGPWYFEPEGLGFLRNFGGGLVTTGGLEHVLFMAEDTAEHYSYPPKQTERYGLHGRISNRPAALRGYGERWEGDECVLWAGGDVSQASVFGEQLVLRRSIEARVGESRLIIRDEVENVGHAVTPHMFLYHVNIGWPVVDDGAELMLPATAVRARDNHDVTRYRVLDPPQRDFVEQVFEHELASEADGRVPVGVVNRRINIGAYQIFNARQMPHHFVWRMLGAGTYVVGLEPCTNRVEGRLDARARGELIQLNPAERRQYELELGALEGASEIETFADWIAELTTAGAERSHNVGRA